MVLIVLRKENAVKRVIAKNLYEFAFKISLFKNQNEKHGNTNIQILNVDNLHPSTLKM